MIANEKLDKSTLRPISVTYEEIKAAIQHPEVTDSFLTGAGQLPVSSRITTSDNQTSKVSFINRFRQNRTTGHFNHDQSHQGGAVIHSLKDSNINDSKGVDEWLEEYGFGNDPYF